MRKSRNEGRGGVESIEKNANDLHRCIEKGGGMRGNSKPTPLVLYIYIITL